jgi:hypothetical protein
MGCRRVPIILFAVWVTSAHAQTLPWPAEQSPPAGSPAPSGAQQTLCSLEIARFGRDIEVLRAAARTANDRNAKREEVCRYLSEMAQAASRLMRYAVANGPSCGLTPNALAEIKTGSDRAVGACRQICIVDATAGRLDDVPAQFVTPMRLANSNCGDQ